MQPLVTSKRLCSDNVDTVTQIVVTCEESRPTPHWPRFVRWRHADDCGCHDRRRLESQYVTLREDILMQTIAVTGALGQLGSELCRQLGDAALPLDLPEFDILDAASVQHLMARRRPAAIFNCAAYTAVDQAEQDEDTCHAINAQGVAHLAIAARTVECPLLQISTDYVFDGVPDRDTPLCEDDTPVADGVYAQSKLLGEEAARRSEKHFVVRTCGLYGISAQGNNFVETMLRLGRERSQLRIVSDQHCTPTYTTDLARALLFLLRASAPFGTYHVVNAGSTTWYDFAREIFRQAHIEIDVQPITTAQYGAAAPRPSYSVLDTSKYEALGGPRLPPWPEALAEYLHVRETLPTNPGGGV